MTESEVWQQIEQYAIEGNWTGVGVLGDWLQEQGIAEGETVCWWAKQRIPNHWAYCSAGGYGRWWVSDVSGGWSIKADFKTCLLSLHSYRIRLKALLT